MTCWKLKEKSGERRNVKEREAVRMRRRVGRVGLQLGVGVGESQVRDIISQCLN